MSKDLEYFTGFLAEPSAYSFDDFFRMVREWAVYIENHKDEFDYLADDQWKEIRERLIAEFENREDEMEAADDEWDEICEVSVEELDGWELVKFLNRKLEFMNKYQHYFKFREEDIAYLETNIPKFIKSLKKAETSDLRVRLSKIELDESIAEFDDHLVNYYERTGKIPIVPSYPDKKKHRGN